MQFHTSSTITTENQFEELVLDLKNALGPSSGLTCHDVDTKLLMEIMRKYHSAEEEWKKFALVDPKSSYTRNLVDQGNGKSNLVSRQAKIL